MRLPTDDVPPTPTHTVPTAPPVAPSVDGPDLPAREIDLPSPSSVPSDPPPEAATEPTAGGSRPAGSASPPIEESSTPSLPSAAIEPGAASTSAPPPEEVEPSTGSGAPPLEGSVETPGLPTPMGHVVATGDAIELWMRDDDGNEFEPGAVPSGDYTVYARFQPDQTKEIAARITVTEGVAIHLSCRREFQLCKAQ